MLKQYKIIKNLFIYLSIFTIGYFTHRLLGSDQSLQFCQDRVSAYHERRLSNIQSSTTIFLGDSHVEGLTTSAIVERSENLGMSGETSSDLLGRLRKLKTTLTSDSYVVCIGTNDILKNETDFFEDNLTLILDLLGSDAKVLLLQPPPFSEDFKKRHIDSIPKWTHILNPIRRLARERGNVEYLQFYSHEGVERHAEERLWLKDGIHLNQEGYKYWINNIRNSIDSNN